MPNDNPNLIRADYHLADHLHFLAQDRPRMRRALEELTEEEIATLWRLIDRGDELRRLQELTRPRTLTEWLSHQNDPEG